jgi:hypothetical protein
VLGQHEHTRAGAGVQRGRQWQGICVETTPKEFVCTSLARVRWTGGGVGQGHVARLGVPAHGAYTATRAAAGLRRGLDGALSATSARPVGQAA